jgi:hypothetical protein
MIPGSTGIPYRMLAAITGIAASTAATTYAVQAIRKKETALDDALTSGAVSLVTVSAWELFWWGIRRYRRTQLFEAAKIKAAELNRPLVVVGAPDGGVTRGYGCGDVTIDLSPSVCPNWVPFDITKQLPFSDNSVVVFCSCVLEYVEDPCSAISELERISGGFIYFVGVEPWTLTSLYYPGAKQTLPEKYR